MTERQIDESTDLFEEDEAVEDVVAAFEVGPHGVTAPPFRWAISELTETVGTDAAIGDRRLAVLEVFPHLRQVASQGNTTSTARRSA